MFGINSLKQLSQIGEGWAKDIMNKEQQLYESRIKICKKCPLFTDDLIFKGKCDAKKYYNPETNELEADAVPYDKRNKNIDDYEL